MEQNKPKRRTTALPSSEPSPSEVSTEEFFEAWKNGTLEETLLKAAKLAEENAAPNEPSFHEKLKSGEPFTQNGVTFTPHSDSGPVSWGGSSTDPGKPGNK